MNKPSIITTPSGDRMAIIPLADYERLVEAAEDAAEIRAATETRRKLASGEEELIPAEFANRILDGENPVRVWREYRGMSAKELAEKAGVSAPYLSQIEASAREGSLGTMKRIAEALNVALDDLV